MEQSNVLAQKNEDKLKTETERLQERNSSPCRCWIWMLLSIVCFTFIGKSSQKVVVVRLEILFVREIAYRENRNLIFQPWSGSWSFLGNESGMTSYDNAWFNLNLTSNRKLLQNNSNFLIYHRQTSASLSNVSQMNVNVVCLRFRLITLISLSAGSSSDDDYEFIWHATTENAKRTLRMNEKYPVLCMQSQG